MQRLHFKIIYAIVLLLLVGQLNVYSQEWLKTLKITTMSESVSIPFAQVVLDPIHPGISVGGDLIVKDETQWYRSLGVEAGYYYHRLYEHAIMIDGVYNFGYTFNFKLRTNFIAMLGYKHSILTGETFVYENGEYKLKQHWGKPQVSTKVGFGLEYPITKKVCLTTEYLGMIAVPYSPDRGMPYATHALIKIGTKIKLH